MFSFFIIDTLILHGGVISRHCSIMVKRWDQEYSGK